MTAGLAKPYNPEQPVPEPIVDDSLDSTAAVLRPPGGAGTIATLTVVNSAAAPSDANTLGVLSFENASLGPLASQLLIKLNSGDLVGNVGVWTTQGLLLSNNLTVLGVINDASASAPANALLGVNAAGTLSEYKTIGTEQEAYSAGTIYSLTDTAALLDFGTTDPTITIGEAGTYLIYWGASLKYNAATFAGNQTATVKVRRTNNTAADIANAVLSATTRIITTVTDALGVFAGKPVKYVAAAGDIIQVWGFLSEAPAAGSVDATDAWILIVKIQ